MTALAPLRKDRDRVLDRVQSSESGDHAEADEDTPKRKRFSLVVQPYRRFDLSPFRFRNQFCIQELVSDPGLAFIKMRPCQDEDRQSDQKS
jgi:hypothetical protein